MLAGGRNVLGQAWWIAAFPGAAITTTVIPESRPDWIDRHSTGPGFERPAFAATGFDRPNAIGRI